MMLGTGQEEEKFGALEPEDDLDAFNDETFGGGDNWEEGAHEQLAVLNEEERQALKQSEDFFQFGSDGEELGGELEDALESEPVHQNGVKIPPQTGGGLVPRLDNLSLQQPPLTVQPAPPPNYAGAPQYLQQIPPSYPLLPPSHFTAPAPQLHDPAIMSLGKLPPPQYPTIPSQQPPPPHYHQTPPPVVPGLKTMADVEAELLYGPPPPITAPQPIQVGSQMGHVNPAIHNLTYPGMRDRQHPSPQQQKIQQQQNQQKIQQQQQKIQQQQQQKIQLQQKQQQIQQQQNLNLLQQQQQRIQQQQQQQFRQPGMPPLLQHQQQHVQQPLYQPNVQQQHAYQQQNMQQHPNFQQHQKPKQPPIIQQNIQQNVDQSKERRNDYYNNDRRNDYQQYERRHDQYNENRRNDGGYNDNKMNERDYFDRRVNDQFNDQRRNNDQYNDQRRNNDQYNDPRRGDSQQGRRGDQGGPFENANRNNRHTFGDYFDQATRRDLMPGHVHTLGILRHSRSRHERADRDELLLGEGEDCLLGEEGGLLVNPTGDPLLDAKMLEEQAELAKKRADYANSEDEYAGLMSQRDKQWIINIQLNQLKCDNPYVDDYYFTMYEAKKEAETADESKAGGQLLLTDSLGEPASANYKPTQFENSLGKLQVVTVKAPRQIIDVGIVRSVESPLCHLQGLKQEGSPAPGAVVVEQGQRKSGSDYKQVLMQIEVLYLTVLDLEADQLKLTALPTGAPLREQVSHDEDQHIRLLQSGLSRPDWLADCLSVAKGRYLVVRALSHLGPDQQRSNLLHNLLSLLHIVARGDVTDNKFWNFLNQHITTNSLESLETATQSLTLLKRKNIISLLGTSLGATTFLALLHKANTYANNSDCTPIWSEVATQFLSCLSDPGVVLGFCWSNIDINSNMLDNILPNMDKEQKDVWQRVVVNSSVKENKSS